MGKRITGRLEILVNGQLLLNKAGAVAGGIGLSGEQAFELTPVMGASGIHGYVENPVEAYCEVTVSDREDQLLDSLARIRENGTLIFRSAGGGKVYTMEEATCTRNFTITGGEGETTLRFVGNYWTESVQ